jgi:hypothetical protein
MKVKYFIIGWCARAILVRIERELIIRQIEHEVDKELKAMTGVFRAFQGKVGHG